MSTQSSPAPDHYVISITIDTDDGNEPMVSSFCSTDRLTYETLLHRARSVASRRPDMKVDCYAGHSAGEMRALADFLSDIDEGAFDLISDPDADFDTVIPA